MTKPRVFINKLLKEDDILNLNGEEFHYLARVRRIKVDDEFLCVDETGREFKGVVLKITNKGLTARFNFLKKSEIVNNGIILYFGLLKGEKNEFVINMATQIGVSKIVPLIMERTIISIDGEKILKKLDRFKRVAKEAARVSYLSEPPLIEEIKTLDKIEFHRDDLKIMLSEKTGLKLLSDYKEEIKKTKTLSLFFGPEGGITEGEFKMLNEKGFIPVSLSERVVKAEIAILFTLSVINFLRMGKL
jgi:16S rRNA (uracil1498-N3)-methyltransferase